MGMGLSVVVYTCRIDFHDCFHYLHNTRVKGGGGIKQYIFTQIKFF